jgi:hypothetical protein
MRQPLTFTKPPTKVTLATKAGEEVVRYFPARPEAGDHYIRDGVGVTLTRLGARWLADGRPGPLRCEHYTGVGWPARLLAKADFA